MVLNKVQGKTGENPIHYTRVVGGSACVEFQLEIRPDAEFLNRIQQQPVLRGWLQ